MGKVIEKVMAEQLSQYCESYSKLYPGHMGGQKERSVIDVLIILVHVVQKKWEDKSWWLRYSWMLRVYLITY